MTVLSAARAAVRRQDEQLVTLVAQALDPWPVRVFVDEANLRRLVPLEVSRLVAVEARRRWHALEPLPVPANVELGQGVTR